MLIKNGKLKLTVGESNRKLGPVRSYSQRAIDTCDGMSEWCAKACYADRYTKRFKHTERYQDNEEFARSDAFIPTMVKVARYSPEFRIHVAGDFNPDGRDSSAYVRKWVEIIKRCPRTAFWAYTRSWRIAEMLPALEELRALPNMQLFASTDMSIPEATPEGWRVAHIDQDARATGYACPEQNGRKANCKECRYCFLGKRGNVVFATH